MEVTLRIIQNNDDIKVTCPGCKSVLGVGVPDIRYNEMSHHGSPFKATCAACGTTLNISSTLIPKRWYDQLGVE